MYQFELLLVGAHALSNVSDALRVVLRAWQRQVSDVRGFAVSHTRGVPTFDFSLLLHVKTRRRV